MLRDAPNNAVFHVEQFAAAKVMIYISRQANQTTGRALSREGYGTKRSCIRHLVRCHNSKGHSKEFEAELGCLWKGFTRTTTTRKARARRRGTEHEDNDGDEDSDCESEDEEEDDDDRNDFKEGKVPMTPELFRKTCMWLLQWGTMEGIFGALFMALSWHLACRGINTAKVRFSHISWTSFDYMDVNFKHRKTQQHGEAKRQKRAVYSNPLSTTLTFHFFWVYTCHAVFLLLSLEVGNYFRVQVKASRTVRVQYLRKF
jgi:hypothetical protein